MKQILNDDQKTAVQQITDNHGYGDLIPNELLYKLLGMPESNKRVTIRQAKQEALSYMSKLEGIKDYLLEHHKYMLVSSRGKGYLIIKPSEQVQHAVTDYFKAAGKAADKCRARISNVNEELLTKEQRRKDNETRSAFARLQAITTSGRSDMSHLIESKAV